MVLHFLLGPTASGKTELALRWAEAHGAEILYCDAFCVYKGMDIGTAKPSAGEQQRVRHHGIDLVPPTKAFSITDYVAHAHNVVAEVIERGAPLLITGGSGFYAKTFFAPVTDQTRVPAGIREQVRQLVREQGPVAAVNELLRLNPEGVQGIDLKNPRRVQAALERCLAAGKPLRVLQQDFQSQPLPFGEFEKKICFIERDRDELYQRVDLRARQMIQQGLVDEVRRLRAEGFEQNPSAASAIGYREVIEWLDSGQTSTATLAEQIAANTRRLVKKQLSYFRNQLPPGKQIHSGASGSIDVEGLYP